MKTKYSVINLIQTMVDNSFFIETPKATYRIVDGKLFGYDGKYFFLEDVLKAILKLYKFYDLTSIDLGELHDILYSEYIDDKNVLNAIQNVKQ